MARTTSWSSTRWSRQANSADPVNRYEIVYPNSEEFRLDPARRPTHLCFGAGELRIAAAAGAKSAEALNLFPDTAARPCSGSADARDQL
jgi:hypothetical protein